MKILFIRHAEALGQDPDAPLSITGVRQAQRLAKDLSDHATDAIFSSPYARALATITPLSKFTGQAIQPLEELEERRLAPTPLSDWRTHLKRSFEDHAYALDGAESMADATARALRALHIIHASGAKRPVAVTHGNLLASLLAHIDPDFGYDAWDAMGNAEVYEITLNKGAPQRFAKI